MPVTRRPTTQAAPKIKPRNMRQFIPLVKHTDINQFPKKDYQRFPLMPIDKETNKPFVDEYGAVVKLYNEDEENEFRAANPTMADVADSPQTQADELQRLREENARLKAAQNDAIAAKADKTPNTGVADLVAGKDSQGASGGKPGKAKDVEPKLP